jgi:hypothetical protein
MPTLRKSTLALVSLMLWSSPARSQDTDPMVAEEGAIHVMLLRQKSVRDALKLTDEESKKIRDHNDRQWKKAKEIHKLPREQREARYEALTRENEQFLDQVLEPAERKRLEEISLQVAGLLMATSPKVAAQLNLSDTQKQELKRHQEEARRDLSRALEARQPDERDRKMEELHKTCRIHLNDVLTDEQEAKWKKMTGEKFEGKFRYDPAEQK